MSEIKRRFVMGMAAAAAAALVGLVAPTSAHADTGWQYRCADRSGAACDNTGGGGSTDRWGGGRR